MMEELLFSLFMGIGTVGPLLLMLISEVYTNANYDYIFGTFVMPKSGDWFYIIFLGLFATMAQIYMTKAYSVAKAGIIGTISYANIAFSILIGIILGDKFPDIWIILGISLIVVSGFFVSSKKD